MSRPRGDPRRIPEAQREGTRQRLISTVIPAERVDELLAAYEAPPEAPGRPIERTRTIAIAALAGKASEGGLADFELADMSLVGHAPAARLFGTTMLRMADSIGQQLQRDGRLGSRLPTDDEWRDLTDARDAVMRALDAQERRALADEPPIVLSPSEYR